VRILVVGGGGREHALCWKLSRNPTVDRLYAAPGNAGIAELAATAPVAADDVAGILELVERESIDLTVVGPELPLVVGLADEMQARGMAVFGPTRDAARLEGSKAWGRSLCHKYGIPAPRSRQFEDIASALDYLDELTAPYVVKADGLAGGKGVTVAGDRAAAQRALEDCLVHGAFGEAGLSVVVEEYLEGLEVTAMAITDGSHVLPLAFAQDYKRALEGDRGPNTGGMGALSPLPWVLPSTEERIVEGVLRPTIRALNEEGVTYRGVLYAGLMLTAEGPKVLEFNCRFGDPETQVVLPRLRADLTEVLLACVEGNLSVYRLGWSEEVCLAVVLASAGYPGQVEVGRTISGLAEAAGMEGILLFHSGTAARDDRVVTAGGRVLTVTAVGKDSVEARGRAYEACSLIDFEGVTLRRDIGERHEMPRAVD
jgi:phosphoribosylamine---glycine ligase